MSAGVFSLRYRIALTIFGLEALMMVIVLWNTLSYTHDNTRKQLHETEQVIVELLSDMTRTALLTGELDELQYHMEQVIADPHVVQIMVTDSDKNVVVSTDFSQVGKPLPQLLDDRERFWQTKAVEDWGQIAIQYSNKELIEATQSVTRLAVFIALSGMVFIAVAGLAIGWFLTRRLDVLKQAATRIAEGELQTKTRVGGGDEIAVLGQAFDQMASRIQSSITALQNNQSALQQARDELEIRVQERTAELSTLNEQLQRMTQVDGLTNIANRRYFDEMLDTEWKRRKRNKAPLSLLLLDIDYFKHFNDGCGHQAGDDCLIRVAQEIKAVAMRRAGDLAARYGGEEFAVILPNTDAEGSMVVAENIRKAVEGLRISHPASDVSEWVTVSIGAATLADEMPVTAGQLIFRADQALYQVKATGRNSVTFQSEPLTA